MIPRRSAPGSFIKKNDVELAQLKDKSKFLSVCESEYESRWHQENQDLLYSNCNDKPLTHDYKE